MGDTGLNTKSWTARLGILMRGGKGRGGPKQERRNGGEKETKKEARKLSKKPSRLPSRNRQEGINELGEHEYGIFGDPGALLTEHGDGVKDHTEMLHGLAHQDSCESMADMRRGDLDDLDPEVIARRKRRAAMLASVPVDIWLIIQSYLGPVDRAHLALTNKAMYANLGTRALGTLNLPSNRADKIQCLRHIDRHLPNHLLCFVCAIYHARTNPGSEKLSPTPAQNPVFTCPASKTSILPRTRLAHPRALPYAFVQLATRAARYGPAYGVAPEALSRGWRDPESGWSHRTTFQMVGQGGQQQQVGHLLMRVRSQVFTPPSLTPTGMRHLLFERGEYLPYFSACAHWRDGVLMDVCKCALSHVPEPPRSLGDQLKRGPHWAASQVAHAGRAAAGGGSSSLCRECVFCQPARRCPWCPSEYLVKVSLVEDKGDPVQRFKYAIVVTRWCDLGDGSGPGLSPEWDALNGITDEYASFDHVGRRSMMGVFESKISGVVPGAGLLSMDPDNMKGKRDDMWY